MAATDPEALAEELLGAWQRGEAAPAAWQGRLAMQEAYAVQMAVLQRVRAAGERQCGWKLGQTNSAMRAERGERGPAPGFLLARDTCRSGHRLDLSGADNWYLEPELVLALGAPLQGPGITPERVRQAVAAVHPALELVRRHDGWEDRALLRAVNGTTSGHVLGAPVAGCPTAAALDDLRIEVACDGHAVVAARAGDVTDNPLASTAWLANFLAPFGERLQPGQIVLTGSYSALLPLRPGQRWQAQIGTAGTVALETP